jgi:sialate O-acetylesterase
MMLLIIMIHIPFATAWADVAVPAMFSDHAVLQRDMPLPIWGTASVGEEVTVEFAGQTVTDIADSNGHWKVTLPSMPASTTPRLLRISSDNNSIVITDVLVGEVWIGSGQSNMQRPLSDDCDAASAIADAENYTMRFFNVTASGGNVSSTVWEVSDANSAPAMSAVHFYFGRHLAQNLPDMPIGLITSAVGATAIERWATCAGSGTLYTGQIVPLQPYGLRGATWYQGEWDSRSANDAGKYYWQLPCLIEEWRSDWGQEEAFPFYVVQMPKMSLGSIHVVRDAELQTTLADPQVEMIVTIDQSGRDVHPACKDPFGTRLAMLARELEYDQDLHARSPLHNAAASYAEDGRIAVAFDHVADGLESTSEPLAEWEIADAGGNWYAADAVIGANGDEVLVWSISVPDPVSARYAFSSNPAGNNLVNSAGLPASPIREVTPAPAGPACGNLLCESGEDRCTCDADCGPPLSSELDCDDGMDDNCDGEVDCDDPDCSTSTLCTYCGDGFCDPDENPCSCADDCGTPPASETDCSDGRDEDCDDLTDCADADCVGDPVCPITCDFDGVCDPGEDCNNCPADCDSVTTRKPANRYCCGNGVPEGPENDGRCDGNP